MKKRATIIFIGLVLALGGGAIFGEDTDGPKVYNYTGEDFQLNDSTTFSTEDLVIRHKNRSYGVREFDSSDSLSIWIHYLGVPPSSSISGVMNFHVNSHGWPAIGYHSGVAENGDVYIFNSLETISYHTRGQNTKGISIVLWGDYREKYPTKEQFESLMTVIEALKLTLPIKEVSVHRRAPNARTICPSDMAVEALENYGIIEKL